MSFIKTFEQFKTVPMHEAGFSGSVTKIQPKADELVRWKVVLRYKDQNTISEKNPAKSIIDELARNGEFKNWWNNFMIDGKFPAEKALAIIYTGVSGKKNLFGKEVAKAEVAFFQFGEDSLSGIAPNGSQAGTVFYDVTKIAPLAETAVDGSNVMLTVWHEEDLPKMKIKGTPGFIEAKDKSGAYIPLRFVNPPYMHKNGLGVGETPSGKPEQGKSDGKPDSGAGAGADVLNAVSLGAASPEMIAVTDKFIGLKMNNAFNQLAKDLQEIIIKNGGGVRPTDANQLKDYDTRVSAATKIRTDGGADGLYGNATATSIGVLIGTNQAVAEVTKEVADKLAAAFTGVSAADAAALIGKSASTGSPARGSGSGKKPKPNPGF